jgi:serine/threonine-protein kinase
VVHRDVKPDNILISRRSGCLLADFGIAKLLESTTHLTQTGASVGTPTYMSPEQIQGEADVDGRSDIYSLGVVLYQMATGRPPFQGNTIQAIQLQHLTQPPPPPQDLNPDLSPALVEVVLKALEKNPDARCDWRQHGTRASRNSQGRVRGRPLFWAQSCRWPAGRSGRQPGRPFTENWPF